MIYTKALIINNKILSEKYNWSDSQSRNIYKIINKKHFYGYFMISVWILLIFSCYHS